MNTILRLLGLSFCSLFVASTIWASSTHTWTGGAGVKEGTSNEYDINDINNWDGGVPVRESGSPGAGPIVIFNNAGVVVLEGRLVDTSDGDGHIKVTGESDVTLYSQWTGKVTVGEGAVLTHHKPTEYGNNTPNIQFKNATITVDGTHNLDVMDKDNDSSGSTIVFGVNGKIAVSGAVSNAGNFTLKGKLATTSTAMLADEYALVTRTLLTAGSGASGFGSGDFTHADGTAMTAATENITTASADTYGQYYLSKTDTAVTIKYVEKGTLVNALDFSGVEALAGRVSADLAELVTFEELKDSTAANGEARISAADGKIKIQATDVRMASYGLGHYIREIAGGHISWCGNQLPSTWKLPESEVVVKPLHPYAIAYNYCTLSYTMAYWGLDAWQAEIDRLALQGYNVALVTAGLQKVWKDTLTDMGYSADQIKQFIADDAVSAWWHMGNLQGKGNFNKEGIAYEVSDEQIEYDGTFGEELVTMMRAVGVEPIIQSFIGLIPSTTGDTQLEEFVLTSAKVAEFGFTANELTTLGLTADAAIGDGNARLFRQNVDANGNPKNYADGQRNPDLLDPTSKAFAVFSKAWNKNLAKVYGFTSANPPKYLGGDLFHESSPPSGMSDDDGRLCAVNIQKFQKEAFGDDVIWILQSWQGSPDQRVRNGLDPANTLIQCLDQSMQSTGSVSCNIQNQSAADSGIAGAQQYMPWVWCEVMNFGGNTGMHGAFRRFKNIGNISDNSLFKGYGLLSEGLETNPSSYEMYASTFAKAGATSQNITDEAAWLKNYRMRRYGLSEDNDLLKAAHELCAKTAWDCQKGQQGTLESVFCAPPAWSITKVSSWGPDGPITYNREDLVTAARYFLQALEANPELWDLETFKYDFVEIFQQILTDKAREMLPECQNSKMLRNRFRTMIDLLDDILACSDEWRLDKKEARLTKTATKDLDGNVSTEITIREQKAAVKAYRRMVTSWVPGSWGVWTELGEYAHRSYAGLIKHYYGARWKAFLDVADGEMTQSAYDTYISGLAEIFHTMDLTASGKATPVMTMANAIDTAEAILAVLNPTDLTWTGVTDNTWEGANWVKDSDNTVMSWEDGANVTLADMDNATLTTSSEHSVGNMTLKRIAAKTYSAGEIGQSDDKGTDLGWTGVTKEQLLQMDYVGTMKGAWVPEIECTGYQVKAAEESSEAVTVQMQVLDTRDAVGDTRDYVKFVCLQLTVADGTVYAKHLWAGWSLTTSDLGKDLSTLTTTENKYAMWSDSNCVDGDNGLKYAVTSLTLVTPSKLTISGQKMEIAGDLMLHRNCELTLPNGSAIASVDIEGDAAILDLGSSASRITINEASFDAGTKLIIKGSAANLWQLEAETQGVYFKTAAGESYVPQGEVVYVCATDETATEHPLTVDRATGLAIRELPESLAPENAISTTATNTGWSYLSLADLAKMEYTGTMLSSDGTTSVNARGYNITQNADNVTVEMLATDDSEVKTIKLTFTLNGTAVYVAADVEGLSSLIVKPAVARADNSNYASFDTAYTIARDYADDKQVSIISDVKLSTALQVKDSVTVTVEPGVVLISGVTDVPDYNGDSTVIVKGTLDLANTRWTISSTDSNRVELELYAGGKIIGAGDEHGAIEIHASEHTIPVYAATGETEAEISAPIRMSHNAIFDVVEGVTLTTHNFVVGNTPVARTVTKSGAGTLVVKGTIASNVIFAMGANESGALQRALAPAEVFKVKNATANVQITSADVDYKVVVTTDEADSTITVYTSTACEWVANVTEKKADASEGDAGTKFEDIKEAKAYLLEKLPTDPDAKLWLMGALKAEPPTHEGWMTDTRFVAAGIRMWPIAATVNGTAYETLEEAISNANGAEITVGTVLDLTPPEGWVISEGKLVAFSELVYTEGTTWEGATWTPAGLGVTTAWVDGKGARFVTSASLAATDVKAKNLVVASNLTWGGAKPSEITTSGTLLHRSWLTQADLLAATYTGWAGGGGINSDGDPLACIGYYPVAEGNNAIKIQMQLVDGKFIKTVCLRLTANSDGTLTATQLWTHHQETSDAAGTTNYYDTTPAGGGYCIRGLTIALAGGSADPVSVTVNGALTIQEGVVLGADATLSAASLETIPSLELAKSATLVLGDSQKLTIQSLEIPEGGILTIKGSAATIPAESLYFTDADGYALNLPAETVYYLSTAEGATAQELMVDVATGEAKVAPQEMGTNWITTEATATGWTDITLAELSKMVFTGKMDVVSEGTTTTTDAQGYSISLANETLSVTMKNADGTSVGLTFTADANGAIFVKANEASTTQGVHSLSVAPAEAILYTDAAGTNYSNYADFATAFDIATADTSDARYLSLLTDVTMGSAYSRALKNGVVFTIEEGVTVTSSQNDVPDWGGTCTIVVKGTLDLAATRWSFAANNSLKLYTGAQILGSGQILDGVNVGGLDFDAEKTINVSVATDSTRSANDMVVINPPIRVRNNLTFNVASGATLRLGTLTQDTAGQAQVGDRTLTKTGEGSLVLTGTIHNQVTPVYSAGLLKRTIAVGESFKVKNATDTGVEVTSADTAYMVTSTTDTTTSITTYTLAKIVAKVVKDGVTTNYPTLEDAQDALAENGGKLYLVDATIETPEGWVRETGDDGAIELWKLAARIGTTNYRTVQAAVDDWEADDTLVLVDTSITSYPDGWHKETLGEDTILRRWVYWKADDSTGWATNEDAYIDESKTTTTPWTSGYRMVFSDSVTVYPSQTFVTAAGAKPIYITVTTGTSVTIGHNEGGSNSNLPKDSVIELEDGASVSYSYWGANEATSYFGDLTVNGEKGTFGSATTAGSAGILTGTAVLVIEEGETITATSVANPVKLAGSGTLKTTKALTDYTTQVTCDDADKKVYCTESSGTYTYALTSTTVAKIGDTSYESITAALVDGTSVEVVGRATEDVDLSEDATLTVNGGSVMGTITVPENVTLTLSGAWNLSETVFAGAGTVKMASLPTVAETTFKTASDWTGTVALEGTHNAVTDFDPGAYGKSGSKVQIDATFTGNTYFKQAGTCDAAVVLNGTLRHTNGWSNGDGGYRFTGTLTGTGTLETAANPDGNNVTDVIAFTGDASAFAGTITVAGGHCVAFGEKSDAAKADTPQTSGLENTIQVVAGKTVSIASDRTWTAPAGFVIAGTLADGSNLTFSENSTSTVTGTLAGNHTFTIPSGATVKLNGAVLKEEKTITANGAGSLELVNENGTESDGAAYCNFAGTALLKVTGDFIYGLGGKNNKITNPVEVATGGKLQIRAWDDHDTDSFVVTSLTVNGDLVKDTGKTNAITAPVVVSSTATLSGKGTISIPVTVAGGAILDARESQLTISSTLTWPTDTAVTVKVGTDPTTGVAPVLKGTNLPRPTLFTVEYNDATVADCAFTSTAEGLGVIKIPEGVDITVNGEKFASITDALTVAGDSGTVTVSADLTVATLDLSAVSSKDKTEGVKLSIAEGATLTVTKELILGTNRGFFGWDADDNPDTSMKDRLVVADGAKVTLIEGPVEGSPLVVNWTMSDTVPVTLYTLNYVDDTTTADEVYTTANGKVERVTESVTTGDGDDAVTVTTVKELEFLTSITGKGTWYEWLFDDATVANRLASTGRNTTALGPSSIAEGDYVATTKGYALKLSAGGLQDHLVYADSLESPTWSASFFARMPSNAGGVLVSFGSAPRKTGGCLALVRGKEDNADQVVLVYIREGGATFEVLADMTVPHATTDYHLYTFVKYGDHIEIFLDNALWTTVAGTYTVSNGVRMGNLYCWQWTPDGSYTTETLGTYSGTVAGGALTLAAASDPANSDSPAAIDMLRIYDCYLELAEVERIAAEYQYVSPYSTFERTITTDSAKWNETDAWTKTITDASNTETVTQVAYPEEGDVTLTVSGSTSVEVNMTTATDLEGLAFKATSDATLTFTAGTDTKQVTVTGNTMVETNVEIDCMAMSLGGPVMVAAGKTLTLNLSDALLSQWGTEYATDSEKMGVSDAKTLTGFVTLGGSAADNNLAQIQVIPDTSWGEGVTTDGVTTYTKNNFTLSVWLSDANSWMAKLDHGAWAVAIDAIGAATWKLGDAAYTPTAHTFLEGAPISVTADGDATLLVNGGTKEMTVTGAGTVTLTTPTDATVNALTVKKLTIKDSAHVICAGNITIDSTDLSAGTILSVASGEPLKGTLTISAGATLGGTGTIAGTVTFEDGAVLDATDATATACLKLSSAPTYKGTLKVLLPASFAIATKGESVKLLEAEGSASTTTTLWLAGSERTNITAKWLEGDLTATAPNAEEDTTVKPVVKPTVTPVDQNGNLTPDDEIPEEEAKSVSSEAAAAIVTEFVKVLDEKVGTGEGQINVTKADVKVETVIVKGTTADEAAAPAVTLETHSADAASLFDNVLSVEVTETTDDGGNVTGATATATIAYDFGVERFTFKPLTFDVETEHFKSGTYIILKAKVKGGIANKDANFAKDTKVEVTFNDVALGDTDYFELLTLDEVQAAGFAAAGDTALEAGAKFFAIKRAVLEQVTRTGAASTTYRFGVKASKSK